MKRPKVWTETIWLKYKLEELKEAHEKELEDIKKRVEKLEGKGGE